MDVVDISVNVATYRLLLWFRVSNICSRSVIIAVSAE